MVKIRIFIPHPELKEIFDQVVNNLPKLDNLSIEQNYIFGTRDEKLAQNEDADILVARGMTCDVLRDLFPEKHVIQIELVSFDILDALVECREKGAKKIGLCLHGQEIHNLDRLSELVGAPIQMYDTPDEQAAEIAIARGLEEGVDVFVGAGTMCGICDKQGLSRVHIHTKYEAVEEAMLEALEVAKTINLERARTDLLYTVLNNSEDGVVAVSAEGLILAINNQACKVFELSTVSTATGSHAAELWDSEAWKNLINSTDKSDVMIRIHDKNYYVQYKPLNEEEYGTGAVILIKNADVLMEEERLVRRSLTEKGLTAKYSFKDIRGKSESIHENIRIAERYSKVNSNVLLLGESGTGKELFAHSIHQASKRSNQPFVALNCATLPEHLLESELFGYEAGAFSGASKSGKIGLFEMAHKGTIFLDEIGEVPITLQAKLLRVLQEREIRRVGSTSVHPVDVRVISATNINLEEKIQEGKFRADLYYRLNLLDMTISPLRERKEDIQELVDAYLTRFACEMGKSIPTVTPEAAKIFQEYSWPGNIRELRNICERIIVLNDTNVIDADLLRQIKIFQKPMEKIAREQQKSIQPEDSVMVHLQQKKKKKDLAQEMGVSRTTLWRMAKRQKELERMQHDQ